jgi:hypothetical protein
MRPSGTVLIAVTALVVGIEAPALAHQVNVVAHKISGSQLKPNTVTGKQVKESTLATVPSARTANHVVAAKRHLLTLIDGWQNDADFAHAAAYTIDAQGFVHLEGAISSTGIVDTPFVLPPGARPRRDTYEPVLENNGYIGDIYIRSTGDVEIENANNASPGNEKNYTGLDGVTFPTH